MEWLPEFWLSLEKKRFGWGVHDCLLFAADALVVQGRPDAAAPYRGTYASAAEADDVISQAGGFIDLFEAACDAVGVGHVDEWTPGAVAVVSPINNASMTVGAMWSGRDWWFTSMRGIGAVTPDRMKVISTWRY